MTTRAALTLTAGLVIFALGGVVGCQMHAHFNPVNAVPLIGKSDTIVSRETIRVNVPFPVIEDAGKITVKPHTNSDTAKIVSNSPGGGNVPRETIKDDTPVLQPSGDLDIPITRKTYTGADFKAVVSGWRPSLDSMTVYPKTTTITTEKIVYKPSRFAITAGVTYGYDGQRWRPVVGLTAGYVIFSR